MHNPTTWTRSESGIVILVDMDGVLADFDEGFVTNWELTYLDKLPFPIDPKRRRQFYIADAMPADLESHCRAIYLKEDFFLDLPPIPGGKLAIETMEKFADVRICTSPLMENRTCVQEKLIWVERNLGQRWVKKTILTKDKTLVRGDFLIDDKPEISGIMDPVWEHIIFDNGSLYNKNRPNRYLSWKNYMEVLGLVKEPVRIPG